MNADGKKAMMEVLEAIRLRWEERHPGEKLAVVYCQGCGATKVPLAPLQDPQNKNLRGAVRWLCAPCIPTWQRSGWSGEVL